MKRRQLNALAHSLCAYLCSRNNDIAGYWGIGVLCAASKRKLQPKISFRINPGELLRIEGYVISESTLVTNRLLKFGLDSIEGRLSFIEDGIFPDGAEKFICGVAIAITQGGRTGMSISHIDCWSHDASREQRRYVPDTQ